MVLLFSKLRGVGQKKPLLRDSRAFSLIELLVVLNIITYLVWFTAPAFLSIFTAQGVSAAAYDISSAIEQARNEAVSRRTYVWLGIQEEVRDGALGLRIAAVRSKDGQANTKDSNLIPIGKPLLVNRIGLTNTALASSPASGNGAVDLSDALGGIRFRVGAVFLEQGRTITFMPKGEVTTNPVPSPASGFDPMMFLSLCKTSGTNLASGNEVTLIIDGSVGTPTIYRK